MHKHFYYFRNVTLKTFGDGLLKTEEGGKKTIKVWEGESDLKGVEDVFGAVLVRLLGGQLSLLELQELPPKNLEVNTDVYRQYFPHRHPTIEQKLTVLLPERLTVTLNLSCPQGAGGGLDFWV